MSDITQETDPSQCLQGASLRGEPERGVMISRLLPIPGAFLPSLSRCASVDDCWRESGSEIGVYRSPFPRNLLSLARYSRVLATAESQWQGFEEDAETAGRPLSTVSPRKLEAPVPSGHPSAARGKLSAAARPPPVLLRAWPTPSTSRAASRTRGERTPRFSPGRFCPGGSGERCPLVFFLRSTLQTRSFPPEP